jgi:hypothetical protein
MAKKKKKQKKRNNTKANIKVRNVSRDAAPKVSKVSEEAPKKELEAGQSLPISEIKKDLLKIVAFAVLAIGLLFFLRIYLGDIYSLISSFTN